MFIERQRKKRFDLLFVLLPLISTLYKFDSRYEETKLHLNIGYLNIINVKLYLHIIRIEF